MPATSTSNPASSGILVEACVDSVESARAAEAGGAGRVELAQNLFEGGTTPSAGLVAVVRERVAIPIHLLVRPRGGDFVYDDDELRVMLGDIASAKSAGVDGIVLGALLPDGEVDDRRTRTLIEAARPLSVTFHRAFDLARDHVKALDALMAIGVDRVLTSGGAATALDGLNSLGATVRRAGDRCTVIAAGSITDQNVRRIVLEAGVREVHVRASIRRESPMRFRRAGVPMGKPYVPDEYARVGTSSDLVRLIVTASADAVAQRTAREPITERDRGADGQNTRLLR